MSDDFVHTITAPSAVLNSVVFNYVMIYSHTHDDFPLIKNKQCALNHNVIKNYRIENSGWRGDGMYKVVAHGLHVGG